MKVKALFLLSIFMLNTVFGFGCSLFVENNGHKNPSAAHHHKTNIEAANKNGTSKAIAKEDSCCKTLANNIIDQGKLLADYAKTNFKVPALIPVSFNYRLIPEGKIIPVKQGLIAQHLYCPPNPDIRVSIQSFQI